MWSPHNDRELSEIRKYIGKNRLVESRPSVVTCLWHSRQIVSKMADSVDSFHPPRRILKKPIFFFFPTLSISFFSFYFDNTSDPYSSSSFTVALFLFSLACSHSRTYSLPLSLSLSHSCTRTYTRSSFSRNTFFHSSSLFVCWSHRSSIRIYLTRLWLAHNNVTRVRVYWSKTSIIIFFFGIKCNPPFSVQLVRLANLYY